MPVDQTSHNTQIPPIRIARLVGTVVVAAALFAGCGSAKSDSSATKTTVGDPTATTASGSPDGSSNGSSDTSTETPVTNSSAGSNSELPDPCSLLTTSDINTVLVGADDGTRQLSACVWTDPEGTAARLVLNRPTQGTPLDVSQGSPLDNVGGEAIIATAPGTVRIIARADGIEIAFSVDTGTSDIKPNQANAIALVNKVIDQLP